MNLDSVEQIFRTLNSAGVRFVSIPTRIKMKETAKRDGDDTQHLRWILAERIHE